LTPFPVLITFPVKTFLGQITWHDGLSYAGQLVAWCVFFTWLAARIWRQGSRQYSGIGI
jgi:ABC-type uncharacterized transport system permease subunit